MRYIEQEAWEEGTIRGEKYLVSARNGVVQTIMLDLNCPDSSEGTVEDLQRIGDKVRRQRGVGKKCRNNRLTQRRQRR